VLATYTAAVFLSALLLFGVQPMFTRMVLPQLGGSPSVWSIAMVFFQTMLLAGYAYAHWLAKVERRIVPVLVHLALLAAAALTLPLTIAKGLGRTAGLRHRILAAWTFYGFNRPAVFRARGEQSVAAGVVRPHRTR
jgi:hypothetical protein